MGTTMTAKLYKVLIDGKSCHGEDHVWDLPKKVGRKWVPGQWHEIPPDKHVRLCERGFHLYTKPYQDWYEWGSTVYEAEGDGEFECDGILDGPSKIVFQKARLTKPAPKPRWLSKAEEFIESIKEVPWLTNQPITRDNWLIYETREAAVNATWGEARIAAVEAAFGAEGRAAKNAALIAALDADRDAAKEAVMNAVKNAAKNKCCDVIMIVARGTAWRAANQAALNANWDLAWDASSDATMLAGAYIISNTHPDLLDYAFKRWSVWQSGYGLLCDVGTIEDPKFIVYRRP